MTPEWCAQLWRQVYEELYLPDPESYYMTDEDLRMTEDNNSPFRKTIKAETELRDLIAWAKIGTYDADNNPFEDFEEYSATDVKKAYKSTLSRYSATKSAKPSSCYVLNTAQAQDCYTAELCTPSPASPTARTKTHTNAQAVITVGKAGTN